MPIALLLDEIAIDFAFGANKLSPWVHLVAMEEKLIDRARSAFLVKWLGRGLPLRGSYLKVAIENLEALRNRYLAAAQSVEPEMSGLNLTEPLAGIAGQIGGILFSPTGVILLTAVAVRKMKTWLAVLLGVLAALASPLVTGLGVGLGVGIGLPAGFIAGLYVGATKQEETGAIIGLLGALVQLLIATGLIIDQLLGPREKVANPLLRQVLQLFDRLAGLGVQLLGFVAVIVTEVGPLLLPLAAQVRPFAALIESVLATLSFIWGDMLDQFEKLMDPKLAVGRSIDIVVDAMTELFPALVDRFIAFFKAAWTAIKGIAMGLEGAASEPAKPGAMAKPGTGFRGFFETLGDWLNDAVNKSPLVSKMKAGAELFAIAADAFSDKSSASSSSPSTFPAFPKLELTPAVQAKAALGGEPWLGFGDIGTMGTVADALSRIALGGPMPLSAEAAKLVERARHPVSVFALEKGELRGTLGGITPETALKQQLESQQKLRSLIAGVIGRLLPPESRTSLEPYFAAIDASIYEKKAPPKKELPVRDIPDNGLLRPMVRKLTFHSAGGEKLPVEDFAQLVRKALLAQTYPAPTTA